VIIRDVNSGDAGALAGIYQYYVEHFAYSFEYAAPSTDEFAKRIAGIAGRFPFFVCENGGKNGSEQGGENGGEILGFAYAHPFHERKAYQWVCETSIYARQGCTQKGIGSLLYGELLPALKRQGFVKAYAVLGCPNEGSGIFHQKMGFTLEATLAQVGYKLGSWHDIEYYSIELNPFRQDMPEPLDYRQVRLPRRKAT
jgi:phosphinothricin acetyltransferase